MQKQEDATGTRLSLVSSTDNDLWESLGTIIETLQAFLPTSSDPSGNAVASFHRHIASDTLLTIRDTLLLPLLSRTDASLDPTAAIDAIVQNVIVIQKAAAFEESLMKGAEHGSRVIREFADGRAGNVYVGARKSWVLGRLRDIVGRKWGHWEGVTVEMERKLGGAEERKAKPSGTEERTKPMESAEEKEDGVEKEEDGWGLDDTPSIPPPAEAIEQAAPAYPAATGADEEDGWGFDEDDMSAVKATDPVAPEPSEASPPSPPLIAPKPIRQARKIGKKSKMGVDDDDMSSTQATDPVVAESPSVSSPPLIAPKPIRQARKIGKKAKSSANTTSEGSGTASPALDSSMERFTSPPVGTREAREEKDASGWDMEWEPEPVVEAPPRIDMPVSDVIRERMKVSVALDDVIAIVIDELQFVDAFQQAE